VRASGRILERRRPHVVLGGGGFVSGPVVVAAARRRIPAAITEADAHLGLANRLSAPFARRVFLAFPIDGRDGPKYRVTGRPLPARSRPAARGEARARFELPTEVTVLLVFGGSQGARALNEFAIAAFGEDGPAVLHICGEGYVDGLRARVRRADYRLLAFTDDFGSALRAADLALARAGGSVWELAAAGLPAVLVPSPNVTADHQTKNARHFERGGGAVVIAERDLSREPIDELLADPARLAAMRAAMLRLARPRAAEEIAEELIALAS
jgi:UDP-N-acetylglucosamine--N-acetylmuramyl-(pentapeptide) pyrophosphoryl-undecaprenol N-acetylglucosamine transferase